MLKIRGWYFLNLWLSQNILTLLIRHASAMPYATKCKFDFELFFFMICSSDYFFFIISSQKATWWSWKLF